MTFPEFADWKAPWEEKGEELDPETAKKLVYNLKKSEAESKEKLEAKETKISEADAALETYRKAEAAAKQAQETAEETRVREQAERDAADKAEREKLARENMLLRVQVEKGLTEAELKRISGNTLEELLADADEFIQLVPRGETEEVEEEDEEGKITLRRVPKPKAPIGNGKVDDDVDIPKYVAEHAKHPLLG